MYIKVKLLKNGEPHGREDTCKATVPVSVGQEVSLPGGGNGVVTEINVPENEVESFKDRIKEIENVVENQTISLSMDDLRDMESDYWKPTQKIKDFMERMNNE